MTTELNEHLTFPHVGQVFKVERIILDRKTGEQSQVIAYGIISKTPELATAEQVLRDNRQHWIIENSCHYILDWSYNKFTMHCTLRDRRGK